LVRVFSVLDSIYTLFVEEQYVSALQMVRAAYSTWPDLPVFNSTSVSEEEKEEEEEEEDKNEEGEEGKKKPSFDAVAALKNIFFGKHFKQI
jgi:CO dehydrogenase/acetyl-CoA synthase beta subunit